MPPKYPQFLPPCLVLRGCGGRLASFRDLPRGGEGSKALHERGPSSWAAWLCSPMIRSPKIPLLGVGESGDDIPVRESDQVTAQPLWKDRSLFTRTIVRENWWPPDGSEGPGQGASAWLRKSRYAIFPALPPKRSFSWGIPQTPAKGAPPPWYPP